MTVKYTKNDIVIRQLKKRIADLRKKQDTVEYTTVEKLELFQEQLAGSRIGNLRKD